MTRTLENDDFAGAARRLMMSMRVRLLLALVALIDACRSDTLNRRYAQPLRSLLHRQLLPTAAEPQPPGVLGRNRLQRLRGGGVSSAPLLIGIDGGTESIRGNILVRKSMRRLWERDSDCSWSICSGRFSLRRHAGRRCLCILPDCIPKARLGRTKSQRLVALPRRSRSRGCFGVGGGRGRGRGFRGRGKHP